MKKIIGRKNKTAKPSKHDTAFMRLVVRHYETSDLSISQIATIYGISRTSVAEWKKKFSADLQGENLTPQFTMTAEEQMQLDNLKNQNEELLKKLGLANLKIIGLETMIDMAEEELQIDIRKKSGTKQSGD